MKSEEKATLSVEETARYLNIGRSLCYRMIRENKIPHLKFASRIIVPKAKLDKMLSE